MATLMLDTDKDGNVRGFLLKTAYEERHVAKSVGGRWDASKRCWKLSLDADIPLLARSTTLFLSEDVERFLADRRDIVERLIELHTASDAVVKYPQGLDAYQRVGVRFLVDAGSAILADAMGLGKTPQAVRACEELGAKVLVVTKKSLIHNWVVEITRWSVRPIRVGILATSDMEVPAAETDYVVTNYEAVVKHVDKLAGTGFDVLVVDEATAIKNRKTNRSKALHRLAKTIPHRFLLTGTPVHSRPDELWSLLHCVDPYRYTSYWRFVDRFCLVAENFWGGKDVLGVRDREALAKELAPVMLHRDKTMLNLPEKSFETVLVELSGVQKQIYDDLRTKLFVEFNNTSVVALTVLALLTRLRQVVCTPALIGGPDESAKTDALLDILDDVADKHKVLVFTTFAEYVKVLMPRLVDWGAVRLTGDMSDKARWDAVTRFQTDNSCRVMVGTVGAMGEGLNLTAADIVIFLNREWVPAVNAQAEDRAHRRGQTRPVHIINVVADNTVDIHVEHLLARKRNIVSQVEAVEYIISRLRHDT